MKRNINGKGIGNALVALLTLAGMALTIPANAQSFFGPRAYFQTSNGTYLMAQGGGGGAIYGNSPNRLGWEEFEIWDLNGGDLVDGDVIALRTAITRQYVSDNGGQCPATADRWGVAGWELFQVIRQNGGGRVSSGDLLALRGWHGQSLAPRYDWDGWRVGCWFPWIGQWEVIRYIDRDDSQTNRNNCVLYARSRVPSLPYGMSDLAGKRHAINTQTPSVGSVAILNIYGTIGHVAVVEQVHGDGTITIREGNNPANTIRSRRGTPASMHIDGYYRP